MWRGNGGDWGGVAGRKDGKMKRSSGNAAKQCNGEEDVVSKMKR